MNRAFGHVPGGKAPLMGRSFVARRPFDELRTSLHRRAGLSG